MFLDWKESVLSKGKLGLKLSEFQEKYNSILDFKTMNLIFLKFKKTPYCFYSKEIHYNQLCRISCRWESLREECLENFILNNPQLNEICSQILRKIFESGPFGISQHTVGNELGLKSHDIHHHINNLIKFQLVKKKNFIIKSKSKLNNIIQLKCKIFENLNKKKFLHQNFSSKGEFEIINKLIKIFSRIDRSIKQKDLKYGTLKKIDSENSEKRRFHRNWQKTKQKFFKAGINLTKLTQKNFIIDKKKIFKKILSYKKTFNYDEYWPKNFYKMNILVTVISFILSPEIQIKKIIDRNYYSGVSSPYFLEKLNGYVSYKTIQFILKNLEEKRYLSKTLEQKGRQRIIRYRKWIEFELEKEKKFEAGVTYQTSNRRLILLSWVKSKVLLVKDLGRKIALKENKGLRKVDSKVIRRVLTDLIEKNFLKIFKINIRILNQKSRNVEVITRKEFDTKTFDLNRYLKDIHKNINISGEKKFHPILQRRRKYSIILFLDILFSLMKIYELLSYKLKAKFNSLDNFNNFIILMLYRQKNFQGCKKIRKTRFYSRYFFLQKKFFFKIQKKYLVEKKNFFIFNFKTLSREKLDLGEKNQNFKISKDLTKSKYYHKTKQFIQTNEKVGNFLSIIRKKNFNNKLKLYSFFSKKFLENTKKKVEKSLLKKKKNFEENIFNSKLVRNGKSNFPVMKLIQSEDFKPSILNFEKWDSEFDINLLESFFIIKFNFKKKDNLFLKKKPLDRRLNGVLAVENIKIAMSYLEKFFKFSLLRDIGVFHFNPRNILKRALEFSALEFCFNVQEIKNIKNLRKNKIKKFFKNCIKKSLKKRANFLKDTKKNEFTIGKKFWKINWILFPENYWISEIKLNFQKTVVRIEKNSNKKKQSRKKIERNFLENTFKKKVFLKELILEFCQKSIFSNFYLKFEENLSYMIPFFLNKISKKDLIFNDLSYSTSNYKTVNDLNNEGKFSNPLEVRNRNSLSFYKKHFIDNRSLELNSKCFFWIYFKIKKIGFFEKIKILTKNLKSFSIIEESCSSFLNFIPSIKKPANKKFSESIQILTCLKWTFLYFNFVYSKVYKKNLFFSRIFLGHSFRDSKFENRIYLKIANGNFLLLNNIKELKIFNSNCIWNFRNSFLSLININHKKFLRIKQFLQKKPLIKLQNSKVHFYFKPDQFFI